MANRYTIRSLALGLLLLLLPLTLFAADGRITGRVTREDGSPIGGVIVQAMEAGKAAVTDANGEYIIEGIAPGSYTLQFSAGDNTATASAVVVESGRTARADQTTTWQLRAAETITVYSASRQVERIVDAPAAVSVASEEDIRAAAPTGQATKIIESAPGVDYTQSGLYDVNFSARGFNSSLNRRILTLIDGRDPSVPFLGAQEWAAFSFPIDEMASVELIRGPGSALYGANAFSGVLNMTTRSPRLSPGGRVMVSAGDLSTRRIDARHAGGFGSEFYYRVVGGYQHSDDFSRSRNVTREYPGLPAERVPLALFEVETKFGGLRLDKHFASGNVLTVEGGYAEVEGPVFQTGIGRVQVTDVEHPWWRANYNMPHFNFLGYYDARKANNQIALASGAGLYEDSYNLHAEGQTNWDLGTRMRIIAGAAWNQQEVDTAGPSGAQTLMSEAKSETQQSLFAQGDFDITQKLKLLLAGRWDDSTLHEAEISPKAGLVYSFMPSHTIRYGYNEAFQRPNYSELFLSAPAGAPIPLVALASANPSSAPLAPVLTAFGFTSLPILARGNDDLAVEKVKSHELGYSGIFNGKLFLTVDVYQSKLSNFVTDLLPGVNPDDFPLYVVPSTAGPAAQQGVSLFLDAALRANRAALTTVDGRPALVFTYTNAGEVETQGLETSLNYYVSNNWIVDFNYSHFDFEVQDFQSGDVLLPNSPENKFNLGLAFRGIKFDGKISYRWVDQFRWAAGVFQGEVPEYEVINLSGAYRINNNLGVGVDVSNALDDEHWEAFGGDLLQRRALGFVTYSW